MRNSRIGGSKTGESRMASSKKTLHLDRENRKFLGVCAGVANYLAVDATAVRMVFLVGCIFFGWILIPAYFVAWFVLDDSKQPMRTTLTDNMLVNHFRTVDYRKKIWRNKRDAKFFGVCAGIADYLEVDVFVVRLIFLVLIFTTGFPLMLYFACVLVLDEKPAALYDLDPPVARSARPASTAGIDQGAASPKQGAARGNAEEIAGVQVSKRREFQFCAHKFAALHARLARMEAYVTGSRFKLHREFRNIS
jgi:phage shock protein C